MFNKLKIGILIFFVIGSVYSFSKAATIRIPLDQPTIQSWMNTAGHGILCWFHAVFIMSMRLIINRV